MSMSYRDAGGSPPGNKKAPTGTVEAIKSNSDAMPLVYHTDPAGRHTGVWISREPGRIVARRRDDLGRHLTAYLPTRAALMDLLSQPGGLCARTADVIIGGIA